MEHWQNSDEQKPLWERDKSFLHACIAYFVAMLLFVALRVASGLGWFGELEEFLCRELFGKNICDHMTCAGAQVTDIFANVLIQIVIFLVVPLVVFIILSKEPVDKTLVGIGFNLPGWRVIGFAFLLGLMFYFLNIFVASVAQFPLLLVGYRFPGGFMPYSGVSGFLILLVIGAVLPGICEEVSNRGILMRGFMSKLGVWRAVLLSSLIFGLMHMSIVQAIYTAILGGIMALAILATRSLWTGIIIHFMNNALSGLFGFARDHGFDFLGTVLDMFGALGGLVFFAIPVVMYIFGIRIIHMFARENYKKNEKEYFAVFLKNNPEYVAEKLRLGQPISMDEMSASVDMHTKRLSKLKAIRFYLEGPTKPKKLDAIEKTLVFGIIFLTSVVTLMTLVWGMPPYF